MASKLLDFKLEGFDELAKKFDKLDEKVKKKALRPSLRAGAKIIQKSAKSKAHKLSGDNAKFIKVKALKRSRTSFGVAIQTGSRTDLKIPRDQEGYYPFSEEFGTDDTPAHPYMRPALREKRGEATRAVGKELGKRIEQLAKAKA
jgi:HK97 gp10 family phage protein